MVVERLAFVLLALILAAPVVAQSPPPAGTDAGAEKHAVAAPSADIAALAALEERVTKLVPKLTAATVALRFEGGQGSGVIISEDGYVLTAAHIFDDPGKDIAIILYDGREVAGKTLGRQEEGDFALLRIVDEGRWPWASMGSTKGLSPGSIVLTTGHPGGFRKGRPPVLRLGQVTSLGGRFMETTCVIDRGDSGGPVWDLDGKVVGIHSRIQIRPRANFHIAIDKYRATWERLVAGESWGNHPRGRRPRFDSGPRIGVRVYPHDDGVRIDTVFDDLPAAKAGLRAADVITHIDGVKVGDTATLAHEIRKNEPGDKIVLEVLRGEEREKLRVEVTLDGAP